MGWFGAVQRALIRSNALGALGCSRSGKGQARPKGAITRGMTGMARRPCDTAEGAATKHEGPHSVSDAT
jgi:hypothetical protein